MIPSVQNNIPIAATVPQQMASIAAQERSNLHEVNNVVSMAEAAKANNDTDAMMGSVHRLSEMAATSFAEARMAQESLATTTQQNAILRRTLEQMTAELADANRARGENQTLIDRLTTNTARAHARNATGDARDAHIDVPPVTLGERISAAAARTWNWLREMSPYIITGINVAATIGGFVISVIGAASGRGGARI